MREGKAIIILLEGRRTSKTFKRTQYQFTGLLGSAGVCYISQRCTCKATELLLCFMAQFGFTQCLALWNVWEKVLNVPRPELCLLLQSRTHFTFVAALTVKSHPPQMGKLEAKNPTWVSTEQNLPSHLAATVVLWVAAAKQPVNGVGDWIAQSPWGFVMMLQWFLQIIWKQICALNHALYSMLTVLPILRVSIH